MAYGSNRPCSVFRENLQNCSASFSTVNGKDADFWRESANIQGMPARPTHTQDTTAYATQPTQDSWQVQLSGSGSPANTNGLNQGGQPK